MVKRLFRHISSGDSGVWGLKKNFALLELLERLQNGATNQSGLADDTLKGMGEVRRLIAPQAATHWPPFPPHLISLCAAHHPL